MEIELPKRKSTRLRNFDYGTIGSYFITICTQNRRNILSTIFVGEGSPLPPPERVQLSHYGAIVEKWIRTIPEKYSKMSVDHYVIMPNHIHLLLSITKDDGRGDPSPTITAVIGWLKYHSTREINLVGATKNEKVFQRSFHDHIIRDRQDYETIAKYIYENPRLWQDDCFYVSS